MWEGMGRDEINWDEVRRAHVIWDEMICRVRSASVKCKCEVWKCSVKCEVIFLDNICARASHKARTHGRGWRTAHVSSRSGSGKWFMKASVTYEKGWGERRGEKNSDEMQCGVWSVKSAVWSLGHEECSVQSEVWSVEFKVWSEKNNEKSEVWTVKSDVWSVKCGVLRVHCEMKFGMRRVQWELRSAKWSFKFYVWNKTPLSQNARTHGPDWS